MWERLPETVTSDTEALRPPGLLGRKGEKEEIKAGELMPDSIMEKGGSMKLSCQIAFCHNRFFPDGPDIF